MNYRAGHIKRIRRTKAEIEVLERQIFEVLEADHPQSVRHVFYRMTDPRLAVPIEKSEKGYCQLQHRCTVMRRDGRLPYGWFADMSRRGYFTRTFQDASHFVRAMQSYYRADLWRDAACRCEIWCESRSIASVLLDTCDELAVDLYPCGGFPSLSFVHDAADQTNQLGDPRPLHVFYIGDFDPAGVLIDCNLERELRLHLDDDIDLHFHRLAINPDQIERYDLPSKPRKKSDRRALHIQETVEAEAMPAAILRQIVREAIEDLLPPGALYAAQVAEQSERQHLIATARWLEQGGAAC